MVDDEEPVREATEIMLDLAGCSVFSASGGREAIKIINLKKEKIDPILLDMSMPQISGKETLARLLDIDPAAKIIIASGYDIDGPVTELVKSGAKPPCKNLSGCRNLLIWSAGN